ncbi:2,3,4,5-tetrahydropyridine-2,6-dicarboxylate N-acetyltransferase [Fervidobacterium islandicum]|uniref:2,3,4,5-tetrahydropyridine-2,6-dicarboxylate N-acetyltransferase n=1 Tax=Fervidobacterium islandicum TaxID=2423 RepID=UPI003A6E09E1
MDMKKSARELTSEEIIELIAKSKKRDVVRVYVSGNLEGIDFNKYRSQGAEFDFVVGKDFGVLFGDLEVISQVLENENIRYYKVEYIARNSAIPLADISRFNARIEPGAIIREYVEIGDKAVVMMGAVINIGAVIGEGTMVDMNAVIGARARIGRYCHIGAGAVVAGVVEPPSANPVVIEDHVLVGANAVILEGVRVGHHAVVAAGAVVVNDVEPYTVVAGVPAKKVKKVDEKTADKTQILESLREINK